jgi:nucleotide-binding universal stress UspA family protein
MIAELASELQCMPSSWDRAACPPKGILLLGSVAAKVVHLANVPVTLVK